MNINQVACVELLYSSEGISVLDLLDRISAVYFVAFPPSYLCFVRYLTLSGREV